jgi:AcrR family transcriptional regulator
MLPAMNAASNRLHDPRARQAREERILDATAELLLRHGYRRVTIDDIARHADIGKGTVYLHWRTRDELFEAVFEREVLEAIEELVRTLRQGSDAWMLHRLARSYFLIIMRRPLLTAVFLDDSELLGKLARPDTEARKQRHNLSSRAYFELLAEHGLLRADLRPDAVASAFLATLEGFVRAEATADDELGSDIQERADLFASTVQRAFETDPNLPTVTRQAVVAQVIELFARAADAGRSGLGIAKAPEPAGGQEVVP